MSPLANDPRGFREDVLAGLTDVFGRYLERVPGASGVARAGGARAGKVAVVIGGGAGHYPAFAGLVGAGMADGAVVGDVFTSPSAAQAERVARALEGGAGVLYSFGNYAGDVLNFGLAERRLRASGIDCRTVLVTDDVASAPAGEAHLRRGIAGTVAVFKTAGAAAAKGADLGEVERLARQANGRTVSLGVGFAGCTLPGQGAPLFRVEPGKMELGLGIHGEPGVSTGEWLPARELAEVLTAPLLAERPSDAPRAAVLLNGLGSTKYEELFVLWGAVARLLQEAEVEVVLPEVGEFVTSLDMAGCSLTCCWLDDELESLWRAPADTPGFRRPGPEPAERFEAAGLRPLEEADPGAEGPRPGEAGSPGKAQLVRSALAAMLETVASREEELGRLDAVAGDGDHGSGMVRGLRAALAAVDAGTSPEAPAAVALRGAGRAWANRAGGTSGVLWGLLLEAMGEELGRGRGEPGPALAAALRAAVGAVQDAGRARLGDKTMLDAFLPFVEVFEVQVGRAGVAAAWAESAAAAQAAAEATAELRPRVGRARPLAERSLGTPDPGAVSFALCATAVAGVLGAASGPPAGHDGSRPGAPEATDA